MTSSSDPRSRRAGILFIFVTLAIDAIGLGIVIPVLPDVVRRFVSDAGNVSRIYGFFIACYALLQFLSSPLLGRLSDRYGRRPVLLLALLGGGIDYVFMAFAPTLPLLFLGRVISGVSGASYTVASAYIADISDDSNRSKNFGVMGAGFGIGFILGPAIGGLLSKYGSHMPFLAAAAFNLLNFFFGLFVLPESLPAEKRRAFDGKSLNPLHSLYAIMNLPAIRLLVAVHFLGQMAGQTHPSIWTLYAEHRYGWTPAQVGISLTIVGILSALSQGVLTGPIVKKFGERKTINYGSLGYAIAFVGFGLAATGTQLYVALVVSCVFWTFGPALQSLISREVPQNEQGELQGALMSLISISSILNPLIMTTLFSLTSNRESGFYLPGAPYYLGALFCLGAWAIVLAWEKRHPENSNTGVPSTDAAG